MKIKHMYIFMLFILFTSSVVYMIDGLAFLQRPFLASSLAGLLLLAIFTKGTISSNPHTVAAYGAFVAFCLFSSLVNSDTTLLVGSLLLAGLFLSLSILTPKHFVESPIKTIAQVILWSHIPFVLVSLADISVTPFSGVFYTGNALGSITATIYVVVLARAANYIEAIFLKNGIKKKYFAVNLVSLSLLMYLTIISGSRTSVISLLIVTSLLFLLVFGKAFYFRKLRTGHLLKAFLYSVLAIPVFFLVDLIIPLRESFDRVIIGKFISKQDDVLDLRGIVWEQTFQSAGVFGGGRDFFVTETVAAALNTFISILGQYGWGALIFFSIFIVITLVLSVRYMLYANEDIYKYLPLLMTILFILLSTAESMMMKSSMLAMFTFLGVIQNYKTGKQERVAIKKEVVGSGGKWISS